MRLGISRSGQALTLLVVAGLFVTTLGVGCIKRPKPVDNGGVTTEPTGTVAVGKKAPDFTLLDVDGKEFTLSSTVGQKVLLNFWNPG